MMARWLVERPIAWLRRAERVLRAEASVKTAHPVGDPRQTDFLDPQPSSRPDIALDRGVDRRSSSLLGFVASGAA